MLIKSTPNTEKAKSILKMVEQTLLMLAEINAEKYASNVIKEYYEILRELITTIALLDGYKTQGEGAHKELIDYLAEHYPRMERNEINLLEELRTLRNKIAYDGFFISSEYVERNKNNINLIIRKLKIIINEKLS